jgi:hypothetical protein
VLHVLPELLEAEKLALEKRNPSVEIVESLEGAIEMMEFSQVPAWPCFSDVPPYSQPHLTRLLM